MVLVCRMELVVFDIAFGVEFIVLVLFFFSAAKGDFAETVDEGFVRLFSPEGAWVVSDGLGLVQELAWTELDAGSGFGKHVPVEVREQVRAHHVLPAALEDAVADLEQRPVPVEVHDLQRRLGGDGGVVRKAGRRRLRLGQV